MKRKSPRPRVNVNCQFCGAEFKATQSNIERGKGKYCSLDCRYKAAKTSVEKECPICGVKFKVFQADIKRGRGKYCSPDCQREGSRRQIKQICEYCGKEFTVSPSKIKYSGAKFCSKECHYLSMTKRIKCICKNCGDEFEALINKARRGDFCSPECYQEWNHGENNSSWRGGISFEPYCPKFNKELKEKVRDEWGRKCGYCGKTEEDNGSKLRVHHIDYDKEQGCTNKEFFLIPLCTSCHGKTNHNREKWQRKLTKIYLKGIN